MTNWPVHAQIDGPIVMIGAMSAMARNMIVVVNGNSTTRAGMPKNPLTPPVTPAGCGSAGIAVRPASRLQ